MSEPERANESDAIEQAFAEYLELDESGEQVDFVEFCRRRGEVGRELLELWGGRSPAEDPVEAELTRRLGRKSRERFPADLLARLGRPRAPFERYQPIEEIKRGGMGRITRAWDRDLRREVALKTSLEDERHGDDGPLARQRASGLARFLEEAQVTGQLDHPGIVPVHELGLDDHGRPFFALKLVRGRDLSEVLRSVRESESDWSQTRALGVLLKVCEAMAFAHEHGVIHRDLKPDNIMVGHHGEVYVMDWGLARVLEREEIPRVPPRRGHPDDTGPVASDRADLVAGSPGSPLLTWNKDVLGTAQYMPPEQAQGDLQRIGPRSDVYAVGAILYELLSGEAPYVQETPSPTPATIVTSILKRPPTPIERLAPRQPPELLAICHRAMERDPAARYADMGEMAEDLRAFLEHRVVRAWRTGAWVELRKWIERNRLVAALLLVLFVVLAGAGFTSSWLQSQRERERFDRLAQAYVDEEQRSWPLHPDFAPAMERWLLGARGLVAELPGYRAELERLRRQGHAPDELARRTAREQGPLGLELVRQEAKLENLTEDLEYARSRAADPALAVEQQWMAEDTIRVIEFEIEDGRRRQAALQRRAARADPWTFDDAQLAERHARLAALVANLEELAHPDDGALARVEGELARVRALHATTIEQEAQAWERVRASVADPLECPLYQGELQLEPQLGLVPLERDPDSGLWEFWHVLSGERPHRRGDGRWEMLPETGLVLVLVPGGSFVMGRQSTSPDEPNYDSKPYQDSLQVPAHRVELSPYFLSKYEMTQGQWARLSGELPSLYAAGQTMTDRPTFSRSHPVENLGREDCARLLPRWGLTLPTEARWERAARAGFDLPFGELADASQLPEDVNCADEAYKRENQAMVHLRGHEDPWIFHAPVDEVFANAWGLVGMLGNVHEWALDWSNQVGAGMQDSPERPRQVVPGTGEHLVRPATVEIYRGGSYMSADGILRVANRLAASRGYRTGQNGVRPCRDVETGSEP